MKVLRLLSGVLLLLPAASVLAAEAGARRTLEELATQQQVVTSPPSPSIQGYFALLGTRLFEWLRGLLHFGFSASPGLSSLLEVLGRALLWLLLLLCVLLLSRLLAPRLRRQSGSLSPEDDLFEERPPQAPESASAWKKLFEGALAVGRLVEALHALWLWSGLRLAGDRLDFSWTSTELLVETSREDLRPLFRQLDSWRYGPILPAPAVVQELARRLEGAL